MPADFSIEHATIFWRIKLFDRHFVFVGIPTEFWSVHSCDLGGERAKASRDLGADLVSNTAFTTWQSMRKNGDSIVSVLAVRRYSLIVVATSHANGLKAGRFVILQQQVLVIVLGCYDQFNFDKISTIEHCVGCDWNPIESVDRPDNGATVGARPIDLGVFWYQAIVVPSHLYLETSRRNLVPLIKYRQVGVEVNGTIPFSSQLDFVFAGRQIISRHRESFVIGEQRIGLNLDRLDNLTSPKNFDGHLSFQFITRRQVRCKRLDAECRITS